MALEINSDTPNHPIDAQLKWHTGLMQLAVLFFLFFQREHPLQYEV